jgi:hypothetical protein
LRRIDLKTSGDNRRSRRAALTAAKGRPKKEGPRIGYNIDDLNRFALKQNSASYRPPARLHWQFRLENAIRCMAYPAAALPGAPRNDRGQGRMKTVARLPTIGRHEELTP